MPPIAALDAILGRVRGCVFESPFPQEIAGELEKVCEKHRDDPEIKGYLDTLAVEALRINDKTFSKKLVFLADRLDIRSWHLRLLATDMMLSLASRPEEEAEILDAALPDDVLKKGSRRITDEEWRDMQDFADKLKKFLPQTDGTPEEPAPLGS